MLYAVCLSCAQVLFAAAERLQDYDEKVRLAAVKAVCQSARQLLVGPSSSTTAAANNNATAAAGAGGHGGGAGGSGNTNALLSPVDALLGSIGSQEFADAAAADLDLATAADLGSSGPAAAAAAAAVRDLPFVYEALRHVGLRLRDTKPAVRKAAASHLLGIFRAVVAAGRCVGVCLGVFAGSAGSPFRAEAAGLMLSLPSLYCLPSLLSSLLLHPSIYVASLLPYPPNPHPHKTHHLPDPPR